MTTTKITLDGKQYLIRTHNVTGESIVFVKVQGKWSHGAVSTADRDAVLGEAA